MADNLKLKLLTGPKSLVKIRQEKVCSELVVRQSIARETDWWTNPSMIPQYLIVN